MIKNLPLALALFIFGVLVLTASGHTYSPDEESIVYVTRSFFTRGEFDMPDPAAYPVVGGHRGRGGKVYSGTGLASSLVPLPIYAVADGVASSVEPRFHEYVLRLVLVSLFDPLITALTAVLLLAWLRALGASKRAAAALAVVYALATAAAIYARTFYGEPLLALMFLLPGYCLFQYHRTRRPSWAVTAGLFAGLAALTKLQGLLALPALALYYLALEGPDLYRAWRAKQPASWKTFLGTGLLFVLALGAGLTVFAYLNWVRFGDVLQAGRGQENQPFPILTGLYGLLLSSGKSIFLYAPPALLALFALAGFFRKHAAEAVFVVTLIVTVVLFHARLAFWSGDGAWGPRYLVSLLPLFTLPLGALVTQWWHRAFRRVVLIALVLCGVLVNVLGAAVNFDAYLQIQSDATVRQFDPPASPVLANGSLLADRVGSWWNALAGPSNTFVPVRGFLATAGDEFTPRYLAPRATVLVRSSLDRPLVMSLVANDYRPDDAQKRTLTFVSNGRTLASQQLFTGDPGIESYRVQLPASGSAWLPVDLITIGTKSKGKSPMGDELGLHLQSLSINADGVALSMPRYLAIPPLPTADPRAAWAWFFDPATPGFDFASWYLYFSGLDDRTALVLAAAPLLLGLVCVVLGLHTLRVLFPARSRAFARPETGRESTATRG